MPIKSTTLAFTVINATRAPTSPGGAKITKAELKNALSMLGKNITPDEFTTSVERTGTGDKLTAEAKREFARFKAAGANATGEAESYPAAEGYALVMTAFENPLSQGGARISNDEIDAILFTADNFGDGDTVAGLSAVLARLQALPADKVEAGVVDKVKAWFKERPAPTEFTNAFNAVRGSIFVPGVDPAAIRTVAVSGSSASLADVRTSLGLTAQATDSVTSFDDWASNLTMTPDQQAKFENLRVFSEDNLRDVNVYKVGNALYALGRTGEPGAAIETLPKAERSANITANGATYAITITAAGKYTYNNGAEQAINATDTNPFWVAVRNLEKQVAAKAAAVETGAIVGLKLTP
jgi:hypothetical protein